MIQNTSEEKILKAYNQFQATLRRLRKQRKELIDGYVENIKVNTLNDIRSNIYKKEL